MNHEKKKIRVGLIDPPTGLFIREDRCQAPLSRIGVAALRPSIELASMAGAFQSEGCCCYLRDYPGEGKTWDNVRADMASFDPDMLVINTTVYTVHDDMYACDVAKAMDSTICTVARGLYPAVFAEELLKRHVSLDIVVCGESEPIAIQFARQEALEHIKGIAFRKEGKIIVTEKGEWCDTLDAMPFPARNLMNLDLYRNIYTNERETTIQVSRGCRGACTYCVAQTLAGALPRRRSVDSVMTEINECIQSYGIRSFFFRADTFSENKEWVRALCAEIIRQKLAIRWVCTTRADALDEECVRVMKDAGCYAITMGIESGDQQILNAVHKGITIDHVRGAIAQCRAQGLIVIGYFMIGLPEDTYYTIKTTMEYAVSLDLDAANFYIAYPFPGSRFYTRCQHEGLFEPDADKKLPYVEAAVHTYSVSARDLEILRKKMIKRFYLRPFFVLRQCIAFGRIHRWHSIVKMGMRVLREGFR